MYSLSYQIKTLAPVLLATLSGDRNMVSGQQYIPGSVVLGTLAVAWIKEYRLKTPHNEPSFSNLFLTGGLKFTNGYITVTDRSGTVIHVPTPLSLVQKKYEDSMLYDLLLHDDNIEQVRYPGSFCSMGQAVTLCAVDTEIRFHHARDREQGVSREGQIFNYEAIAADQCFSGEILGSREDLEAIRQLRGSLDTVYFGRSRTAEYGKAKFALGETVKEVATGHKYPLIEGEKYDRNVVSLTLTSDLILYNKYGFPTAEVSALKDALTKYLGDDLTISKAFIRQATVESFVGVWKLKRPSETCFRAGSTFLLEFDSPMNPAKLCEVERQGLGLRRKEGFGRLRFGLHTRQELSFEQRFARESTAAGQTTVRLKRPDGTPPQLAKDICRSVFSKVFQDAVENKAIEILETFVELPSATLCARLQAMAADAKDHQELADRINKMRKIAENQLKRCVSHEYNLLEFLTKHDPVKEFIDQKRIERDYPIFSGLRKNEEFIPKPDSSALDHTFYSIFFSMMRKQSIKSKEESKKRKNNGH